MGNLLGKAGLLQSCHRVAAAHDGGSAFLSSLGHSLSHSQGALGESIKLEHAHGAVPDDSLGALQSLDILLGSLHAGVKSLPVIGNLVHIHSLGVGISSELVSNDEIHGEDNLYALLLSFLQQITSEIILVRLAEGLADGQALGCIEGMSHAAADDDFVDLLDHVADDADLIGNLGTADDSHERMLGSLKGLADVVDLFFHEETGNHFHILSNAGVGSMAAMGNTESVIHSHISQGCQLLGELRIVLLLSLVIAEVLQQEDFTGLEVSSSLLSLGAYAVSSPLHILAKQLGEMCHQMLGGELGLASLRRTADMASQDYSSAVIQQVIDGRQSAHHASIVGDVLVLIERNVVVHADKHFFAFDVNVFDGFLIHTMRLQIK